MPARQPQSFDLAALTGPTSDRQSVAEARARIRDASGSMRGSVVAGEVITGLVLVLGVLTLATLLAHVIRLLFGGSEFHAVSIAVAALMVTPLAVVRVRSLIAARRGRALERRRILRFADDNGLDLSFDDSVDHRARAFATGDSRRAEIVVRSDPDGLSAGCFAFDIHRNHAHQTVEFSSIGFDAARRGSLIDSGLRPWESVPHPGDTGAEARASSIALPEFVLVSRTAGPPSLPWSVPNRMVETPIAPGFDECFTTWCLPGGQSRLCEVLTDSVRNELAFVAANLDLEVVDDLIVFTSRRRLAVADVAFWEAVEDLATAATGLVAAAAPSDRLGDYWDTRTPISADPDRTARRLALLAPPAVVRMAAVGCLAPLLVGVVAAALSATIGN